jgi:hypothetical protein
LPSHGIGETKVLANGEPISVSLLLCQWENIAILIEIKVMERSMALGME